MWKEIIDYKRIDKVNVGHNITEAFDLHDITRTLLVRMLRRKHPRKNLCPIYTEFDPLKPNEDYPDIWMRIKTNGRAPKRQEIYVWEIQKGITKEWEKKIIKQYEEVNLIIVDLNKVEKEWIKQIGEPLEALKKILEEYVI
jgi:hypothetical protein